uniref:Uncharacterized protein n=1 Tax=Anguilla anguilla TaxID=7936 RepID=A0A0E9WZ73_ANGAN
MVNDSNGGLVEAPLYRSPAKIFGNKKIHLKFVCLKAFLPTQRACVDTNFDCLWSKSQHNVLFQHVSLVYTDAVFSLCTVEHISSRIT